MSQLWLRLAYPGIASFLCRLELPYQKPELFLTLELCFGGLVHGLFPLSRLQPVP